VRFDILRKITLEQAKKLAIEHVKKEHSEAENVAVDEIELKGDRWEVTTSWPISSSNFAGSMTCDCSIDANSGEMLKSKSKMGWFVGST
jgi:hypothetical protein